MNEDGADNFLLGPIQRMEYRWSFGDGVRFRDRIRMAWQCLTGDEVLLKAEEEVGNG